MVVQVFLLYKYKSLKCCHAESPNIDKQLLVSFQFHEQFLVVYFFVQRTKLMYNGGCVLLEIGLNLVFGLSYWRTSILAVSITTKLASALSSRPSFYPLYSIVNLSSFLFSLPNESNCRGAVYKCPICGC